MDIEFVHNAITNIFIIYCVALPFLNKQYWQCSSEAITLKLKNHTSKTDNETWAFLTANEWHQFS